MLKIDHQKILWEYDGDILVIEPWGANSLRVRASHMKPLAQEPLWALLPQQEVSAHAQETTYRSRNAVRLDNGAISAVIEENGRVTFLDKNEAILLQEFQRDRTMRGTNYSPMMIKSREFSPLTGQTNRLTVRFESDPDEKLYGMGQYQQETFNLKGSVLELAHRNSQVSVPFTLSSKNYGFLWNNPAVGKATFGTNRTEWEAFSTTQMDYWITAGDSPQQILSQYAHATGMPSPMPEFATGFWQCKMRYRTQEELLEVAREYKRRNLPISVIIIDFFHWPEQGVWDFDPEYWPDPEAMVQELNEMGIKLIPYGLP